MKILEYFVRVRNIKKIPKFYLGLDPLLRENLWKFLVSTAKSANTSIIITTHYIEEARQADCVMSH